MRQERVGYVIRRGELKVTGESSVVQELYYLRDRGLDCTELLRANKHLLSDTALEEDTELIDLKDQDTRDALIKLGWTPPKEDK